jgi:hypothetical protein
MKKILLFLPLLLLCHATEKSIAQSTFLEYQMPRLTTLPPYYSGMPTEIALAYYWFDHAMRTNSTMEFDNFIGTMHLNDTAKYIADAVYRVCEDDPISFYLWLSGRGLSPDPYSPKANPSHIRMYLENKLTKVFNDTGRTGFLLNADFIAQVHVYDTVSRTYPNILAKHLVTVSCQVVDMIKGKKIFDCTNDTLYSAKDGKNFPKTQAVPDPYSTSEVTADSGRCLQFEYSLEWDRMPYNDYGTLLPW